LEEAGSIDTAKPADGRPGAGGWNAGTICPPLSGWRRPALRGALAVKYHSWQIRPAGKRKGVTIERNWTA
jgi:hypothetical protein